MEKKIKDKLEWAKGLLTIKSKDINLDECCKKLESERKSYPGWIILPKNQREWLFHRTSEIIPRLSTLKISNSELGIRFIYEINWRWEKCFYPLYTNMQKVYEKVLGLDENLKKIKIDSFDRAVQEKAIELVLGLYRSYREDSNKKKCEILEVILDDIIPNMTLSQKHRYNYERILYASLLYDYKNFIERIENWDTTDAAPIWQVKRAGLLAEIGKQQDSLLILNALLQEVRKQQGKKDIIDEYYLLSIENLTMSLISYIQDSMYSEN
uniref:hypothetical protein n=1 Tax=uncultured Treponema sp. TaxID=162155 RepID=UPI0025CB77DE